ncbi:hypothetical protein EMCRGX_G008570 [Ephydatia muelleri]
MRGRAGRTLGLLGLPNVRRQSRSDLGLPNVRRQSRSDSRPLGVTECEEAEQVGLGVTEYGGGDYTEEFATYRIDTGVPGHDNQPIFLRKHLASLRVLAL